MNFQNTKLFLDKINRLHRNMTNGDNISQVERDLMLQYVRQLYDACLEETTIALEPMVVRPQPQPAPQPVQKKEIEPTPIYAEKPVERIVEKPQPVVIAPPPVVEKPRVFVYDAPPTPVPVRETPPAKPAEVVLPTIKYEPAPEPKPYTPPTPIAAQPPAEPPVTLSSIAKKHHALFEHKEATDIMSRLSESPIEDITRAMGLNERILVVRALFKQEQGIFDQALRAFNGFSSFEEAQHVLLQLAERYDWSNEERREEAKQLIKLVRRRYKKV
jgi:hypothetical protein